MRGARHKVQDARSLAIREMLVLSSQQSETRCSKERPGESEGRLVVAQGYHSWEMEGAHLPFAWKDRTSALTPTSANCGRCGAPSRSCPFKAVRGLRKNPERNRRTEDRVNRRTDFGTKSDGAPVRAPLDGTLSEYIIPNRGMISEVLVGTLFQVR